MSLAPVYQKEIREAAPYVGGAIAAWLGGFWIDLDGGVRIVDVIGGVSLFTLYVLVGVLAVLPISSEFNHGTMPNLLTQPVSRLSIWWHKFCTSVISIGIVIVTGLLSIFVMSQFSAKWMASPDHARATALMLVLYGMVFLSSGAFYAIFLQQPLTALLATLIMPVGILCISVALSDLINRATGIQPWSGQYDIIPNVSAMYALPLLAWSITGYFLARRSFLRLEVH